MVKSEEIRGDEMVAKSKKCFGLQMSARAQVIMGWIPTPRELVGICTSCKEVSKTGNEVIASCWIGMTDVVETSGDTVGQITHEFCI